MTMPDTDRPEQTMDDASGGATPPCVALVPLVTPANWSRISRVSPSSSTFVAHLIATAEHLPQTRSLRRATPADAQSAYSTSQHRPHGNCMRTRQII
jgi:hypothetical protein